MRGARGALGEAGEERFDSDSGQRRGPGPGFAAAWAEGRAMSVEDAVRYALEAGAPPAG